MKALRRLLIAGTATAGLCAAGIGTAHADRTALDCGAIVTTSVRLATDLTDCPGSALVVGAPGITIDLGGHTLDGTGVAPGIDNNGGHDDVTIRRGVIREFAQGIDVIESTGLVVRDLTVERNGIGITLARTQGTRITSVTARQNSFAGVEGFANENLHLRASTVTDHAHGAVVDRASHGSRIERNVFSRNEFYGLLLDSSTGAVVAGNVASDNTYDGFQLGFRTGDATFVNNRAVHNGGHGVVVEEPGNTLRRNTAVGNGGVGIAAVAGTVDGGRNRASGNAGGDCVELTCRG